MPDTCQVCMVLTWYARATYVVDTWYLPGAYLVLTYRSACLSGMYGTSIVCTWKLSGSYLAFNWYMLIHKVLTLYFDGG